MARNASFDFDSPRVPAKCELVVLSIQLQLCDVRCVRLTGVLPIAVVVPTSMLEHGGPVEVFSQFGYGQRLFVESLKLWSTL